MAEIITKQKLVEANENASAWEKYWSGNEDEDVITRLNKEYPTHAKALKILMENGGFQPFETQAQLLASVPLVSPTAAKALDTKKLFLWKNNTWIDTGLSELELAKIDASNKALTAENNAIASAAEDASNKALAAETNAISHTDAKFGRLSELSESTLQQANLYTDVKTKSLSENLSKSLFDFKDNDESIVAQLLENGDLNLAALDGRGVAQLLKILLALSANSTDESSIFNIYDLSGNLVFQFCSDGDILFNGGESLKAITSKENRSVIKIPSRYEFFTDTFESIISSYQNLSHISDLPIPIGLCSQKFKISDKQAFLNLKITQPERIKIDSPYYRDDHVVHPFLCNFYKTFRGFKHILLLTPYHNTDAIFENPCVYGSNDLLNFELLSDMPQPIYERYPGSYNYNSDNFGVYDHTTGEFCVCWRNGTTASGFDLWISKTSDGITWTERERLTPLSDELLLSPNVLFNPTLNKWVMYSISNDVIHEAFVGNKFNYRFAENLHGPWSEPVFIDTPFTSWHQETRYCGNQLITIINDQKYTGQLYLGISDDGLSWDFKSVGMIDGTHLNSYKASIVPNVTENTVQFDIFWTSSNVANGEDLWQLFHATTQPIQIEGI